MLPSVAGPDSRSVRLRRIIPLLNYKGRLMIRGLYRIPARDEQPEDVRVDNDGIEYSIEERIYRARGYEPHMADLPWQENYLSAKKYAGGDSGAARERADRERARQDFQERFRKP